MSSDVAVNDLGQPSWDTRARERFDVPFRHPYHLGLFMAVNAIPGCYAVIDGPDCLYRKAEWIHGKHDLCSTLLDAGARHRIVPTMMHSGEVIKSKGDAVAARIRRVAQLREAELVLVNSMPHVQIIGTQYDKIIAEVEPEITLPIIEVPSRALEFGFPSFFRHALFDSPFLGFRGWGWFVQELCNAVMARPRR